MRRMSAVVLVFGLVVAGGCSDAPTTTAPGRAQVQPFAQATVLDGATGGNPHFFFLPPMVANPSTSGVFNPRLAPSVEICRTTAQDAQGHCSDLLARFTTTTGINNNGLTVEISVSGQHYMLNWNTKLYSLVLDQPFRMVVMLGDLQIGFADVVARKGSKFENATTGTTIDLVNGRTLPIKFRIEEGVVCGGQPECFEGSVGPEGGTFTIDNADGTVPAGTSFPAGALTDTVNLFIQRVAGGECLPTDLQQYQGCYHFRTEPYVPNFVVPVTVGVCLLDPAGVSYFNDGQLRLWKWSEVDGSPLQELESVQIDYLVCPNLASLSSSTASPMVRRLARAGSALLSPLVSLVSPKPAYAMLLSEGGKLSNFSRIGWVRPLALEINAGDAQTGFAGEPLAIDPQVRLRSRYGSGQSVSGWAVNFTASADGNATPATAIAGAAGLASTTWTLASTPGANTLHARVATSRPIAPAPYEVEVVFGAVGLEMPSLTWLPPLVKSGVSGAFASGYTPSIVISEVGGGTIETLVVTENDGKYQAAWNVPPLDPSKVYRLTAVVYGVPLGYIELQAVGNQLRNVSTGDDVLNLDNSRNLPIKFTLWH